MKTWKRNALIAYLVCCLVAVVVYCVLLFSAGFPGFFTFLLVVPCLALVAGFGLCCLFLVRSLSRRQAMLHSGPGGVVNIELGALESTARRSLVGVQGISLVKVEAVVSDRKGGPVIDMAVTAVPFGVESLMSAAGKIEKAVKQSVEAFTDHEVRSVTVNFVEPQNREERKAAEDAVDERARMFSGTPVTPAWKTSVTAADASDETASEEADSESGVDDSVWGASEQRSGSSESLFDKIRKAFSGGLSGKNEDVVEATASVSDAEPIDSSAVDSVAGDKSGFDDSGSKGEDCGQGVEDAPSGFAGDETDAQKRVSSESDDSGNR